MECVADRDLIWRKSSYSDEEGGACVEVAATQSALLVRDSKIQAGPMLTATHEAWAALVRATAD